LVLARVRGAASGRATALAQALPPLRRLPTVGRLRPPAPAQRAGQPHARPAAAGAGGAGRRDPDHPDRQVPRRVPSRCRHLAGLALPVALPGRPGVPVVPAGAGRVVRDRRFLADGAAATGAAGRLHNRLVEDTVSALGGHKSLYSTVHYPPEEFWRR